MDLSRLIDGLPIRIVSGAQTIDIRSVCDDSRQACPASLFVGRPGVSDDGRRFVDDAVERGAAAVLSVEPVAREGVTVLAPEGAPNLSTLVARLADRVHGEPGRRLSLAGITGTNGKTTTAYLLRQILTRAGRRFGLVGTICTEDGRDRTPARLTTPGAVELAGLLRRMLDHECEGAVLEVSSHALEQRRVDALWFEVAVFTNLSGDHLDYHRTVEAYAAAKARLFGRLVPEGTAVVNADDRLAPRMLEGWGGRVLRCRLGPGAAEARATIRDLRRDHVDVRLDGPWGVVEGRVPLVGAHNVANALHAAAAAYALGVGREAIEDGLLHCVAPPGRLEPVTVDGVGVRVLVDYAHTDDALENVLKSLRPLVPDGARLRVVFGCGGDRDRGKRPRMARVAWRHADDVVVTSDNPRTEDAESIIDDVMAGVPAERLAETVRIADRREAIHATLRRCGPDDLVLIAGKGHEDYQIVGDRRLAFDDREVARRALEQLRTRRVVALR